MRRTNIRILITLAIALAVTLSAQSTAVLTGTVTDPSGAVVPGARVLCKNTQTDLSLRTVTSAGGLFRLPDVPVGSYELTISHEGFGTLIRGGIQLFTEQTVDLSLTLRVGEASQSVVVTAPAPLVQATTSDVRTTVDSRQMSELPLNGRNAFQLAVLTPGAVETEAGTVPSQQDNTGLSVNGFRATGNNWALDGGTYTNRQSGSAPTLPNPDTLQEFTALTSNFSAENRGGGAVIKLTTRSGTNEFHGSLFEFLRNDAMDARNFFSINTEAYKQNQYGGTFGGPIKKDKLFFFGSYQGTNKRGSPSPRTITVPSPDQRRGDFNSSGKIIVDPNSGTPFPNDVIPQSRLDPITTQLMPYLPLPNVGKNLALVPPPANRDDYQYMAKIDYVLSAKDHLSGRYFWDQNTGQRDTSSAPGFFGSNRYTNQTALVSETHTFSPSWVMRNSFNFLRTFRAEAPVTPVTMQGLGAKVQPSADNVPDKINVNITSYTNLFTARGIHFEPALSEWQSDVSHAAGAHFLRFGVNVRHSNDYCSNLVDERGSWTYNAQRTTSAAVRNSGDSFGSFLLGAPTTFTQNSATAERFVSTLFDAWMQDDWKVSRRLTFNIGLRYDPWIPADDQLGALVGFVPGRRSDLAPRAPAGLVLSGDPGIPGSVFRNHWKILSPRFGFAFDAFGNGKTIVRGGYGIFQDGSEYFGLLRVWAFAVPIRTTSISISSPPGTADPYAGYTGPRPFPFTPPSASQLATYTFPNNLSLDAFDPSTRPGYTQSWNLTIERQTLPDTAISVAYVGNHFIGSINPLNVNPGVYRPGATLANLDTRRLYPGFTNIYLASSYNHGQYHGLQIQVTKRPTHGLTVQANYTFSKALDLTSAGTTGGALKETPRNPFNASLDKAPADFDNTHSFKTSILYDLPKVAGARGFVRALVNDWQVNSIVSARTGFPFTCRSGVDNALSGVATDTCDQIDPNTARPAGVDRIQQWFNTAAFRQNAVGTFGTVGRNSLRRPGVFTVDLSLFKRFQITERLISELRFEAFNALNHANLDLFYSPAGYTASESVNSPTFGQITHARDPRLMQVALKLRF